MYYRVKPKGHKAFWAVRVSGKAGVTMFEQLDNDGCRTNPRRLFAGIADDFSCVRPAVECRMYGGLHTACPNSPSGCEYLGGVCKPPAF